MTPERRYQVDRAVWLYRRLTILMATTLPEYVVLDGRCTVTHSAKVRALTHRITRWLSGADAVQRATYYQEICALDATETTHARVSRRRGRQLKQMAEASREYDAQFEKDGDDDGVPTS